MILNLFKFQYLTIYIAMDYKEPYVTEVLKYKHALSNIDFSQYNNCANCQHNKKIGSSNWDNFWGRKFFG